MFDLIDNPAEIEKRFKEGNVLCFKLNPNIDFFTFERIRNNYYVVYVKAFKAYGVACGFYRNKIDREQPSTLSYIKEFINHETKPYFILHDDLTQQEIEGIKISLNLNRKGGAFIINCVYYP